MLAAEALRRGADGVVCGHIHHAANRDMNGIRYVNTGDWVESCTAVVEHYDGSLELIRWADHVASLREARRATPAPERRRAVA